MIYNTSYIRTLKLFAYFFSNDPKINLYFWSSFVSHIFGLLTSENVIFQKTNEIYINDAHWYATFVHNLRPYNKLIHTINLLIKSSLTFIVQIILSKQH